MQRVTRKKWAFDKLCYLLATYAVGNYFLILKLVKIFLLATYAVGNEK